MKHINGRMVIGLTGGIGSGKSTVANILKDEFGAFLILTDDLAKDLMKPNMNTYNKVVGYFGREILNEDETINTQKLSGIVFKNRRELEKLNEFSHGDVISEIKEILNNNTDNDLIVIESAILRESGCDKFCDEVWSVVTDDEIRTKRLCESRGYSKEKSRQIMNNQKDNDWYIGNCDKYIVNDGNFLNLKEKISQFILDL